MAYDKVIDSAKLDSAMGATADAIRAKTGSTATIAWNATSGFASAVSAIEAGGSSAAEASLKALIEKDYSVTFKDETAEFVANSSCLGGTNFQTIDLCVERIEAYAFAYARMTTLILRYEGMVTLEDVNGFMNASNFGSSGASGLLYVPAAYVEDYKYATNWSTIVGYGVTVIAIEGSEYE